MYKKIPLELKTLKTVLLSLYKNNHGYVCTHIYIHLWLSHVSTFSIK